VGTWHHGWQAVVNAAEEFPVRGRLLLITAAALALGTSAGGCALGSKLNVHPSSSCQVTGSDSRSFDLDIDQMANASTIATVGIARGLPDHAVTIALATALQESKLHNLSSGDRDSVGLFQQRPSQGWGDPEQLSDPRYAAGRFYDHLVQVDGWEAMPVTAAAQAVQHSADSTAYAQWEDESRILAVALAGTAPATITCTLYDSPKHRGSEAQQTLTTALRLDWGTGLAVTPTGETIVTLSAGNSRTGWQLAQWLVAHADDNGVQQVTYAQRVWTAASGKWKTSKSSGQGVVAQLYSPVKKSN
jgi:hypothetical protein